MDYWKVNSYGYPNPFNMGRLSQQAWETLLSFYEFSSYSRLKKYWGSGNASRALSEHAVESWKAAFEEFGLLFVLTGSEEIQITPAGKQFREAAENNSEQEFAWIGLSLLLRYPLRGPRRPKGPLHKDSDLLLYWFIYAALRELKDYVWRCEADRIFSIVFNANDAIEAVDIIHKLRSGDASLENYPPPATTNAFYNSINQVLVHAGMNYLLLNKGTEESFYAGHDNEQRIWLSKEYTHLIEAALGSTSLHPQCDDESQYLARMPKAPPLFENEESYFEYLGAEVIPLPSMATDPIRQVPLYGDNVPVLHNTVHYSVAQRIGRAGRLEIIGGINSLCGLAKRQRVILDHDLEWTYIVDSKQRTGPNEITVTARKGRPITDAAPIREYIKGE